MDGEEDQDQKGAVDRFRPFADLSDRRMGEQKRCCDEACEKNEDADDPAVAENPHHRTPAYLPPCAHTGTEGYGLQDHTAASIRLTIVRETVVIPT